jgi:hypothetical protein
VEIIQTLEEDHLSITLMVKFYKAPTQYRLYGDFQAFIAGGRSQMHLCTLFKAQIMDTQVAPLMFCKLAG